MAEELGFDSDFFAVKQPAEGVYALIERGDETGSSAGIIDLGNEAIIFDTFLNIDAAQDMKMACVALTGKMPSFVINSHSHMDHIVGNCLFPDSRILSSVKTRDRVLAMGADFEKERPGYAARVEEIRGELAKTEDPEEIVNLKNERKFIGNLNKPNVSIKAPDVTFDGEMVFHGDARRMQLRVYPAGHTVGDVIAILPEEKVCFMGDLLVIGGHPWLGNGEPEGFIGILEELTESDMEYFVPGHGDRVGTKDDVSRLIRYIREIMALVESKKGLEGAAFSVEELSPEFREWHSLCFNWNIEFLRKRG